jgi:hypothetical protein
MMYLIKAEKKVVEIPQVVAAAHPTRWNQDVDPRNYFADVETFH